MHSRLLLLGRIAPLALTNFIPLAHLVDSGPVNGDLWDLGSSFADADVPLPADLWPTDPSADVDLFSGAGSPDPTADDNPDLFLASNAACHAEADLTQFEPYSKLRAREACSADKLNPPLALPTLEKLDGPDDGSVNVEDLKKVFNIVPVPQTSAQEEDEEDPKCPSEKTFSSKVPVCDSGKMTDSQTLEGFPYSTLYNIQLCESTMLLRIQYG